MSIRQRIKLASPGPWYCVSTEANGESTLISRVPSAHARLDLDNEILGVSEWIRVKPDDLRLMAHARKDLSELLFLLARVKRVLSFVLASDPAPDLSLHKYRDAFDFIRAYAVPLSEDIGKVTEGLEYEIPVTEIVK